MKFKEFINEDIPFSALSNKKVRKGIRRASGKDLRDRQFGIELELDYEHFRDDIDENQFGSIDDHLDEAWETWVNNHQDDESPKSPEDFIAKKVKEASRKISTRKSYGSEFGSARNILEFVFWTIVENYFNDNWVDFIHKHSDKTPIWKKDKSMYDYFMGILESSVKNIKGLHNAKNQIKKVPPYKKTKIAVSKRMIRTQLEKYFHSFDIKTILKNNLPAAAKNYAQATHTLWSLEKEDAKHFSKYEYDEYSNRYRIEPQNLKEIMRLFVYHDIQNIEVDLNDLEVLIEENIDWYQNGGEQEAFDRWFQNDYIPDHITDISNTDSQEVKDAYVDAAEMVISPHTKINWDYKWDSSGAVELASPPLRSKDMGNLLADLQYLSKNYDGSGNLSCHIHIEKGKNFGEFEVVATALLLDEDEFQENELRIGYDREYYLSDYAKEVRSYLERYYSIGAVYNSSTVASDLKRLGKFYGTNFVTPSTNNKTVEFRYPSSTMLKHYKEILRNVQYFMALISIAKRRNIVIKKIVQHNGFAIYGVLVRTHGHYGVYQILIKADKKTKQKLIDKGHYVESDFEIDPYIKDAMRKSGNKTAKEIINTSEE